MKRKYIEAFTDMACRFGETSDATRLKVGALLVKNGGVISEGVNGQPPGWPTENCEDADNNTLPTVRHAEVACLEKMWNKNETVKGSYMFVSHCPCLSCAIKLASAGVERVYYRHTYRSEAGLDHLERSGVYVEKVP